jgi:hypothetical protein
MTTESRNPAILLQGLPGGDIVLNGLRELNGGEVGEAGLLVLIACSRLNELGVLVPVREDIPRPVTHALYDRLEATYGDSAYSRYNALLRTLSSCIHALEHLNRSPE